MNILVLGANGFLGREICSNCLQKKWNVVAVYNTNKHNIPQGCQLLDIKDLPKTSLSADIVFFAVGNSFMSDDDLIKTNILLLDQVKNIFPHSKIVFVSSVLVYGSHPEVIHEKTIEYPMTSYGFIKKVGEIATSTHPQFSICRLTSLYGDTSDPRAFPVLVMLSALSNKNITLMESNRQQDYLHVQDAAELCIQAGLSKESTIYLGATGTSITNIELAKIVQLSIKGCSITELNKLTSPSYRYNSNWTKKQLHWEPKHHIQEDIPQLLKNLS